MESEFSPNAAEIEQKAYPNIHFEPAFHPDSRRSTWNQEVIERMKRYSPKIIAVDGIEASSKYTKDFPRYIAQYRKYLSNVLPHTQFSPQQQEIFMVGGDINTFSNATGELIKHFWSNTRSTEEQSDSVVTGLRNIENFSGIKGVPSLEETGIVVAAMTTLALTEKHLKAKISRRQLLKSAYFLGTNALIFGPIAKIGAHLGAFTVATTATDPQIHEQAMQLTEMTKPIFQNNYWYINGRTAILSAKTKDSIDHLQLERDTPSSLLLGNAHIQNSDRYISDQAAEAKTIQMFFQNYWTHAQDVFEKSGVGDQYIALAKQEFKELLASTDILSLTVTQNTDEIHLRENFTSPRVMQALQDE